MKNTFGNRLVNELRKYNKFEDKGSIQFVRNLRQLGFSNAKIASKAGYTIEEFREKLGNPEFSAEINNNLLPYVEVCANFLNEKHEAVKTPRGKFKATSVKSVINAKAAIFWSNLANYEFELTRS